MGERLVLSAEIILSWWATLSWLQRQSATPATKPVPGPYPDSHSSNKRRQVYFHWKRLDLWGETNLRTSKVTCDQTNSTCAHLIFYTLLHPYHCLGPRLTGIPNYQCIIDVPYECKMQLYIYLHVESWFVPLSFRLVFFFYHFTI